MGDAQRLREERAHVGNDVEALDRTLVALGYEGDLKAVQPRGNRIVFFARDELRRFLLDELRKAGPQLASRDLGGTRSSRLRARMRADRRLRNDMVKRVGKSLKLLRSQRLAIGVRDQAGRFAWQSVSVKIQT